MLTMREACTLLNVHGNTLRRWSSMGFVRAYRIGVGRQRRFKAEDIADLVVEQARFVSEDHNGR
jgi:excisionase family DNA binding protein